VAVNLSGIASSGTGLSGTGIGTAREVPEPQQPAATQGPEQDAAAPRPGEVNITSTAALLAQLEQGLGTHAPLDQKRVDSLSRAIAGGHYKVDPGKVASGLLQSEHSLAPLPLMEI
jgi:flagellar biosynthesis anti-sigma factor FlgM